MDHPMHTSINANNRQHQNYQKASDIITLIKGKIWSLSLEEAQKYYQMSEFAQIQTEEDVQQLYKIKLLLQRRIDKLMQLKILDKSKNNNQQSKHEIQKQMRRSRAKTINFIAQELQSFSVIDLQQFQELLKIDSDIMESQNSKQNVKQQKNKNESQQIQQKKMEEHYFNYVLNNIKNISTQNTDILSEDNSQLDISNNNNSNIKKNKIENSKKKKSIKSNLTQKLISKTLELFKYLKMSK